MAIQVSGTQVIGNSRELTNIASVDATTATAIGNAGVGGATALISSGQITSTISYIDFTFSSSYTNYELYFTGLTASVQDSNMLRMTDGSGTLITAAEYGGAAALELNNAYHPSTAHRFAFQMPKSTATRTGIFITFKDGNGGNTASTQNVQMQMANTEANNVCRIYNNSGSLTGGFYQFYGVK